MLGEVGRRRPLPVGARGLVLLLILLAGLVAYQQLDLALAEAVPGAGGWEVAKSFFSRASSPALTHEAAVVPEGTPPIWRQALGAVRTTVVFAAAGASLSLVFGLLLGFVASTAWWSGDPAGGRGPMPTVGARTIAPALYGGSRLLIALLRSVHELLWAVLFLAAVGLSNVAAVIAIALPYSGTLAKVFSEMIDEAPRDAAVALRGAGASPLQVYLFGLLPRALPDLAAYAIYRFECALRSSAILGFFGYPTLGYFIAVSFENLHYGEVWTYLYVLVGLVVVLDWWSGAVRRRLVG